MISLRGFYKGKDNLIQNFFLLVFCEVKRNDIVFGTWTNGMILAGNGETCLCHLRPEPGGVVANAVDKRRVLHQHIEDLRNKETYQALDNLILAIVVEF